MIWIFLISWLWCYSCTGASNELGSNVHWETGEDTQLRNHQLRKCKNSHNIEAYIVNLYKRHDPETLLKEIQKALFQGSPEGIQRDFSKGVLSAKEELFGQKILNYREKSLADNAKEILQKNAIAPLQNRDFKSLLKRSEGACCEDALVNLKCSNYIKRDVNAQESSKEAANKKHRETSMHEGSDLASGSKWSPDESEIESNEFANFNLNGCDQNFENSYSTSPSFSKPSLDRPSCSGNFFDPNNPLPSDSLIIQSGSGTTTYSPSRLLSRHQIPYHNIAKCSTPGSCCIPKCQPKCSKPTRCCQRSTTPCPPRCAPPSPCCNTPCCPPSCTTPCCITKCPSPCGVPACTTPCCLPPCPIPICTPPPCCVPKCTTPCCIPKCTTSCCNTPPPYCIPKCTTPCCIPKCNTPPCCIPKCSTPPPCCIPKCNTPPPCCIPKCNTPPCCIPKCTTPCCIPKCNTPPPCCIPKCDTPPPCCIPKCNTPPPCCVPKCNTPPPCCIPKCITPPPSCIPKCNTPPPCCIPKCNTPPPCCIPKCNTPPPCYAPKCTTRCCMKKFPIHLSELKGDLLKAAKSANQYYQSFFDNQKQNYLKSERENLADDHENRFQPKCGRIDDRGRLRFKRWLRKCKTQRFRAA